MAVRDEVAGKLVKVIDDKDGVAESYRDSAISRGGSCGRR